MSQTLRCAIIEDEPLAQELLEKYVRRISSLELVATFDDAIAAFEQLPDFRPDVIFLDINMPEMTGMEFLRAYPALHPAVILTTANPNHAIEGFDLGVTDYLLKPITFERFMKAIGRVRERLNPDTGVKTATVEHVATTPPLPPDVPNEFIYLKTDKKLEQIRFDEIVFAESMGDYLKVFLTDRFLVTHLTMTKLEANLPADLFLRINRSYIVQLSHIKTLEGNTVITSTGHELIIGSNYRDTVRERIRKWLVV
ncbi:putative response regulatory protein VP0538 [Fibrisoma limi BUZ 3]|uniref:Putative response regulatory protein VP0538 n=1 Tax=Fibrisoma limi BUZ 3 TaxID=1185876 RepID=I2GTR4_9BACT|nr:LytTR family DNA-binding domain-containing protein [Fibrisoma limi]CCH57294.1 putative response regulatory protein VP0538 [Fibrisoma limi BUZ 3]